MIRGETSFALRFRRGTRLALMSVSASHGRHCDGDHVLSEGADCDVQGAFEKANPDIKIEILNKSTVAGIAFVRETAAGQRPDVFWASAPDAFEVLKRDNLLVAAADVDNKAIPAKIGNYPINDPQGFYKGQALAGYGIMYNTRYLKANKLAAPKDWDDLLEARVVWPCRDDRAVALGHDAPDGRNHPAG